MLKFTLCFIKQADKILLLNREHPSWMGVWNGVGGKIEPEENPRESVLREVVEETGLVLKSINFKGIVTWIVDGNWVGGMYTYVAELPENILYETPIKTSEGILDWKDINWIIHPENKGVVNNIPKILMRLINGSGCFEHRCFYRDGQLVKDEFLEIEEEIEFITDKGMIEEKIFCK